MARMKPDNVILEKRPGNGKASGTGKGDDLWKTLSLSVVIPAYNLQDCIEECLDSILGQGIEKLQVIVVENGSHDETGKVLEKYAREHEQIHVIVFSKNRGIAAARNAALDMAIGDYIHFCDGDDLVPKGAYKAMLQSAAEEDADIVTGNYARRYPTENNVIRPFSNYRSETAFERCFEANNTMLWNKIYRREKIESLHLRFEESMAIYEDFLFYTTFMCSGPVPAYTDKSVYVYTDPGEHEGDGYKSKIRYAYLKCAVDMSYAWKKLFPLIHDHKDIWRAVYQGNLNWYYACSWIHIQDPEEKRESYNIIKALLRWVQENYPFCDWNAAGSSQAFINTFGVDFPGFMAMPYETYLAVTALKKPVVPRWVDIHILRLIKNMTAAEADAYLAGIVREQLQSARDIYSKARFQANEHVWRGNYWNLMDALVNDNWRLIQSPDVKKSCFEDILRAVQELTARDSACELRTPGDIERFRNVFCADRVTIETLPYEQYVMVYNLKRNEAQTGSVGGPGGSIDDINGAFVNHCASGRAGMRVLLKAFRGWLLFKLHRNKT